MSQSSRPGRSRKNRSPKPAPRRPRGLRFEPLEDRAVPAMVDLTAAGAEGEVNGALFLQSDVRPTGTGVIDTFLRLQAPGSGGVEEGYNTDYRPLEFGGNEAAPNTRALSLDELPLVEIDGTEYRVFLLDINQSGSQSLLSLDELRLYVGEEPDLTGYDPDTKQLAELAPVFDLDEGEDSWVLLDARLGSGSGSGDMLLFVPEEVFADAGEEAFVYLYSKFGVEEAANDGFEEWAPGPTGTISGTKFNDLDGDGVRDDDEPGLEGWVIYIDANDNGQLDDGETSVETDADGNYRFEDLPAALGEQSTYIIREVQQDGWEQTTPDPEPVELDRAGQSVSGVDFGNHSTEVQFAAGTDAGEPARVTAFGSGGEVMFTVTPFEDGFTGGARTAVGDVNGDGTPDLIVGSGPGRAPEVKVYDGSTGELLFSFSPFEASFLGGVYVAADDVDGDGTDDVVVTPDEGGGPRVRIVSGADLSTLADFFGIEDLNFRGGARAALADVNGDGVVDLLVAAGFGGGPRLAGFDGRSLRSDRPGKLFGDIFVFEPTLRNGVFVAGGDITGDGLAEVIAGGGPGGGPRVYALNGAELLRGNVREEANFFGGDVSHRGGVRVTARDVDADGTDDLIIGSGSGSGSHVKVYPGRRLGNGDLSERLGFEAFPGSAGVFVG